jgi:SAM-dependent methyltransferase
VELMNEPRSGERGEVVRRELKWHEESNYKRSSLDALLYDPPAFDRAVAEGLDSLALQAGEIVLDLGCGEGKETLALVLRGVRVVATDLSHRQLVRTRTKIAESCPAAQVLYVQADAHMLPFAAGAFRSVYGKAVLHHLAIPAAAQEVDRLLRSGGRATFAEPMKGHPLFRLGRRLTPHLRTSDEHPLRWEDLDRFGQAFAGQRARPHMLISPAAYVFRLLPGGERAFRRVHGALQKLDGWLFARWPRLRQWAWYGSIYVRKG